MKDQTWLNSIGEGAAWILIAIAIVIIYRGCNDKPLPFLDPPPAAVQSSNNQPL